MTDAFKGPNIKFLSNLGGGGREGTGPNVECAVCWPMWGLPIILWLCFCIRHAGLEKGQLVYTLTKLSILGTRLVITTVLIAATNTQVHII